jgi:hypothetical protein
MHDVLPPYRAVAGPAWLVTPEFPELDAHRASLVSHVLCRLPYINLKRVKRSTTTGHAPILRIRADFVAEIIEDRCFSSSCKNSAAVKGRICGAASLLPVPPRKLVISLMRLIVSSAL